MNKNVQKKELIDEPLRPGLFLIDAIPTYLLGVLYAVGLFLILIMLSEHKAVVLATSSEPEMCECRGPDCGYALFQVDHDRRVRCLADNLNPDDMCCVEEVL